METGNKLKEIDQLKSQKTGQQSPLEVKPNLNNFIDVDWKYLLSKIYQNINGQSLRKKKSSKYVRDQQGSISSDSSDFKCNCKKTKCLKLYCECFSKGQYCYNCHCQNCNNNSQYDFVRSSIIDVILQKNPNVFDTAQRSKNVICICKKTGCLKRYCQCFHVGKKCGQQCKCSNCQNSS